LGAGAAGAVIRHNRGKEERRNPANSKKMGLIKH